MNMSKKYIGIALCILGTILLVFGLFQVIGPSYQSKQEIYDSAMKTYEECKLAMMSSSYHDIRQNYSDMAAGMYRIAIDAQREMNSLTTQCIILCLIGTVATTCGAIVFYKNK